MILQDALCDVKDRILATGYFFKFYEYTSMVEVNGVNRPMYFIDGENVVDVHDFDVNGSGYIRKTGSVSMRPTNLPKVTACDEPPFELVFPLRAVLAVPKKQLDDNGFSDDMLALELLEVFHGTYPGVQNINTVKGKVLRYETDRARIWKDEVTSGNEPLLNLSYIYIDFELIFVASIECLKQSCY